MADTFEKLKAQKDALLAKAAKADQDIIGMGMDALRCCIGQEPKHFTRDEIIRWIRVVESINDADGKCKEPECQYFGKAKASSCLCGRARLTPTTHNTGDER